ncbi:MAG: hypothetical protein EA356_17430 [Geminicoccaceae bacterium]|nr:MAG: hypothetical protein EA356_17430 [Geminicoccaceae bacterium]
MMASRAVWIACILLLAACAGDQSAQRSALTVIPVPPPMPTTPIPPEGRPADLQTAYAGACALAVFSEVPARVSGVIQVQTDGASYVEFPGEGDLVRFGGSGRVYRGGDSWQPFTFRCVFDTARSSITDFDVTLL